MTDPAEPAITPTVIDSTVTDRTATDGTGDTAGTVDPAPRSPDPKSCPPRRCRRWGWLVMLVLLAVIGALGGLLIKDHHRSMAAGVPPSVQDALDNAASRSDLAALAQRVDALDTKVQALETRPAPAAASPAPVDTSGLASGSDLQALAQRVQTLEQAQPQAQAQTQAMGAQIDAVRHTIAALQKQAADLAARDRIWRDRLAVKQAFPPAAKAALAAAEKAERQQSFWKRVRARIEALVVIRRGDKVIVGDDAAGPLQAAQAALLRDDLAGAVKEIERLHGAAQAAMQPWLTQAQSALHETASAP